MKTLLLLLFSITSLSAAVNGSPMTTQPGPQPQLWMECGNDNFLPHQPDDNLTAEWKGGFIINKYVVAGFSYDMLTEKNYNGIQKTGIREDELTLVAGPHPLVYNGYHQHVLLQICAGLVYDGNLGGKFAQNNFHSSTSENSIDAKYDNNKLTSSYIAMVDIRDDMKIFKDVKCETQFQAENNSNWNKAVLSFLPYFNNGQFTMFLGPTYQQSKGQLSHTSGIVDKQYDGLGALGGIRISNFYITACYNHNHIGNLCLGVESKL